MTALSATPGCPTLTWMIAKRVTDPYEDADAFISFTGRKGAGKSTASMSFCEGLSEDIATLRGRGEDPEQFFNIDHVRSITETGAIELLSSGRLKKQNSIFLLDDTGTQWGSRNFQSAINKSLNSILQICRVYKCVLVANFIMANHVDIQARQMTDFRAQMLFKNVKAGQSVFKFFYLEQGENGKEYKKYMTWNKKRVTKWIIGKPSDKLNEAYKKMRRENTDQFIEDAGTRLQEIQDKVTGKEKKFTKEKDQPVDYKNHPKVKAIISNPEFHRMVAAGETENAISKKLKVTRYWVGMAMGV